MVQAVRSLEKQKVRCVSCLNIQTILVDMSDVRTWQEGELIQNAIPYLTAGERELMISGMCPICWNDTFSIEND
jgi:hypothetical protein